LGRERVLIVGYSTRAFAEAAGGAGWQCASVDAFGDLDQKARVESLGLVRDLDVPYSAASAVTASRRLSAPCVAYVGNLENHPAAVARLAQGRELLGNPPSSLHAARDFAQLRRLVHAAGSRVPLTFLPGETRPRTGSREFLRKPLRGGGGEGVRALAPGARIARTELAQERIDGVLGSIAFLADGTRARVLGLARGLAGDEAFGARGYRYCGSLFPLGVSDRALERLDAVVQSATRAFRLVGLNGMDFVVRDDQPFVLELNPRYSASMELIQRAGLTDLFALHADACRGSLPPSLPSPAPGVWGKAIVWARHNASAPETRAWLERDDIRDVPFPREHIRARTPVCTVLAHARDVDACRAVLLASARSVERALAPSREPARASSAVPR